MKNASMLVLTDPKSPSYADFNERLRPYLDWFGIPYEERPLCSSGSMDYALILLAHKNMKVSAPALHAVRAAYNYGSGLCVMDSSLLIPLGLGKSANLTARGSFAAVSPHKICESGKTVKLKKEYTYPVPAVIGKPVVTVGSAPLLELGDRLCVWHDTEWMSHAVLGPLMGLCDVLLQSLIYTARKPFVVQEMPNFLGMRVDDVWGAWRDTLPHDPLRWVEIANSFGLTPWLGVFPDNVNEETLAALKTHAQNKTATMFPHAFVGCEWTKSDKKEHFIWFDHFEGKPYDDETMHSNARRAKGWFLEHRLPVSKLALPHYYEMGENALPYLIEMGCEFTGAHMAPGTPYLNDDPHWVKAGPFRNFEDGPHNGKDPVFYADYLRTSDPATDGKLFNCVTEIRDVCGYEWAPTNDVEATIQNGVEQITRAFGCKVPAVLFTHESCWIQRMNEETFTASLQGIFDAIERYRPICAPLEDICAYVRAKVGVRLHSATVKGDKIDLKLTGKNDRPTLLTIYTETEPKHLTLPPVSSESVTV